MLNLIICWMWRTFCNICGHKLNHCGELTSWWQKETREQLVRTEVMRTLLTATLCREYSGNPTQISKEKVSRLRNKIIIKHFSSGPPWISGICVRPEVSWIIEARVGYECACDTAMYMSYPLSYGLLGMGRPTRSLVGPLSLLRSYRSYLQVYRLVVSSHVSLVVNIKIHQT